MNRRLLSELRLTRLPLALNAVLTLALSAVILAQAALLSGVIARVFLLKAAFNEVLPALELLAGVIALRALLSGAGTLTAAETAIRVKADLRRRLTTHLLRLGPAYTQNQRSGELTVTATKGVDALDAFFRDFLPAVGAAIIIPLAILAAVLPIDTLTFAVLLVTAPLIPLFMALIGAAAGGLARRQFAQMRRLGAHFLDVMQGLVTLKLFNRSQAQTRSIARVTDQFRQATMRVLRVSFLSAFMLEMLSTLSIAIVAVEIGVRLLNGGIAFEQALFLLVIAPEFYLPLRALGARFHAATESGAAADEIYRVLDTPVHRVLLPSSKQVRLERVPAEGDAEPLLGSSKPPSTGAVSDQAAIPTSMHIRCDDVHYAYAGGARPALNGLTLEIPAGQKTALVGASGSGKSTLAALLLRFIDPQQGALTVDGVNIAALDVERWRARVAWAPQSPYLFNASVAQNIRMGNADAGMPQVIRAAQAAGAHEFISRLPQGYDMPCGERGMRFSGGQIQRIAIARAFLKDAPLLILDEATANLDAESERVIQAALRELLKGRTALVIAHRLNTVMDADRIVVLAHGRAVEQGAHRELLARNGEYGQLIRAFAGGELVA
ncbi:MAG: thiol reductant ABC exporter subunit CydD [Chloroflexi bacterium]|nr:thiol reductant ABC exporter subunit CydD [Chloroflexota bacterium]MCL5273140.1 thiol reductant ABC exporter subunit CydD [Chloroflexota bacterium]